MTTEATKGKADEYLKECYDLIISLSFQLEEAHEKLRVMMLEKYGSCLAGEEVA